MCSVKRRSGNDGKSDQKDSDEVVLVDPLREVENLNIEFVDERLRLVGMDVKTDDGKKRKRKKKDEKDKVVAKKKKTSDKKKEKKKKKDSKGTSEKTSSESTISTSTVSPL